MSDGPKIINRTAKDSVFTHLFSEPKYLLELYRVLHPEDVTAQISDLKGVTIKCVFADHPYNDLGFRVGDRLMILVEAQSSWSPKIVIRALGYMVQSYLDYFAEKKIYLYDSQTVSLPKPELYVIYTGEISDKPEYLSLSEHFFDGKVCCVEAKVKVIYDSVHGDILYQYITFCKIFNEQCKIYGRTPQAVENTIRICNDQNILSEYLRIRRNDIMDIMKVLFDQDEVTRGLLEAKYDEGLNKGRNKGRNEGRNEGLNEGLNKGRNEGRNEAIVEFVKRGRNKGLTIESLMDLTGLSREEIVKIY